MGHDPEWTLGQNIKRLRKKARLTQQQLGKRVGEVAGTEGVTRQTVSRWETDACMPERAHLLALAQIYSVAPNRLFDR